MVGFFTYMSSFLLMRPNSHSSITDHYPTRDLGISAELVLQTQTMEEAFLQANVLILHCFCY